MTAFKQSTTRAICAAVFSLWCAGTALAQSPPAPMLNANTSVDWWFVFKFNAATGPGCTGQKTPACIFGGKPGKYADYDGNVQWGQHFAFASSANPTLTAPTPPPGNTCVGDSVDDPIGATYSKIYNGNYFYVVWNDQFYAAPMPTRASPWGHSKGIVAWDKNGDGVVMQVSTPSWPASGSKNSPRKKDGNTLGCVDDNDVEVSQHFFALKLNKDDLVQVLTALANASVATASKAKPIKQIVKNGGPPEVQAAVNKLGVLAKSATATIVTLSSGVRLISKPSNLLVPPWQMVSALLKTPSASAGPALKAATWWTDPEISPTDKAAKPGCWADALATPGPVAIAVTGTWDGKPIGLTGGAQTTKNHAKIGVSEGDGATLSIFGDMNQQGTLVPKKTKSSPKGTCDSSQDGRGGTFYVLDNPKLFESMTNLLKGQTAPVLPQ
jgi:hypothetical protein